MDRDKDIIRYNESFEGLIFDKDFLSKNYIGCNFIGCNLQKVSQSEILKLFESDNFISDCWFDPTIILSKLVKGLHKEVNLIDSINKSFAKSEKSFLKANKQLVLIDINID